MTPQPLVKLTNISVDLYNNSSDNFSFKKFVMSREFLPKTISILENISLAIHKGDILGIEGANGTGKTTLLSVIAGILPISKGERLVTGRCLPLLGLGHVFHEDLDIRRNIELWSLSFNSNFLINDDFIKSIISEAGLNLTQDVLLRSLSSGMKSRLAFELAMRDSEDILLLDEVFSVGDAEFRARSGDRIKSKLKQSGCAVIVSHDRDVLERNCTQILRIKDRNTIELC